MGISAIKKYFLYLPLTITALTLTSCGGDDNGNDDGSNGGNGGNVRNFNCNIATVSNPEITGLQYPRLRGGNSKVITHSSKGFGVNYSVEWDSDIKSQRWTCYILTKENSKKKVSRYYGDKDAIPGAANSSYPFDPNLSAGEYWDDDYYYGSGFDHGHICPSNDRLYNNEVNYQTFFLTNMQPQYSVFNGSSSAHKFSGLWINMEDFVYNTGKNLKDGDTLFICKGGTIDKESQILTRIKGKLIVPKYFFCTLLLKDSRGLRTLGFWFEHSNVYHGDDPLVDYTMTIDEIEQLTGIDFFCNLPDDTEEKVEKKCYPIDWGLK